MMIKLLIMVVAIFSIGFCALFGDIYEGDNLTKIDQVLLKIEGGANTQFLTSKNYSINIPNGTYKITATHFRDGKIDYITKEEINFDGGERKFDLVLIPVELYQLTPVTNESNNQPTPKPVEEKQPNNELIYLAVGGVLLIAAGIIWKLKNKSPRGQANADIENNTPLNKELREMINIINENSGTMYQKELREILNYSEAKMSISISELEKRGQIKRVRKGRDNLISIIKKE